MINTPYRTLQTALGKPDDWKPEWARRLEVRRQSGTTVYSAHPQYVDAGDLTELAGLEQAGWHVTIDSQRLSRVRINIWQ